MQTQGPEGLQNSEIREDKGTFPFFLITSLRLGVFALKTFRYIKIVLLVYLHP